MRIGVLHPGEMGASVADALRAAGHAVVWSSEGRSLDTRTRAANLEEADTLPALLAMAEAVVSVCPPDAAVQLARQVAQSDFGGVYVDANAISPASAKIIHDLFTDRYVDGGIIGPPARQAGTTRLYLTGKASQKVADWFDGTVLQAVVLNTATQGDAVVQASTLKMAYAAYTKGSSALLLLVNALAEQGGVREALQSEWTISQPGLAERSERTARGVAPKAWRFAGEMREIAATMNAFDLPDGFHLGTAEFYQRMEDARALDAADLQAVLDLVLKGGESG